MSDDGKRRSVRGPEIRENDITLHSPFHCTSIDTVADAAANIIEVRCTPPDYFTLTPKN